MSSSDEEENGTKFLWKIENFSCMKDSMLLSPTFRSHSTTWELKVCPSSSQDPKYISICLHKVERMKLKILNCSLAFLKADGSPIIWKERKNCEFEFPYSSVNFLDFIERYEILNSRRNLFLPNNTLTVMCLIWKNSDTLIQPLECFALTKFEPNAGIVVKSFVWTIHNVKHFSGTTTREEIMGRNADPMKVKLSLTSDDQFEVSFIPSLFKVHMKVKISVMNVKMENIPFVDSEYQFKEKEQVWKLKTNITKSMLALFRNLFLHNGTLFLQFICTQTGSITLHRMVDKNEFFVSNPQPITAPNSSDHSSPKKSSGENISKPDESTEPDVSKPPNKSVHSYSISQALQDMYEEGFLSDYILRASGGKEFPVHKAVLGARSTVFKAMFATEMRERDGNSVDIEDVDEDTLQKLLKFVYSDKVEEEDMGWEDASELYTAADKYALESLKGKCSSILKSGLCASSALGVLKLSDMHQDQDMKSAALEFIERNDREIVGTESWLKFEEENVKLAFETFRKLYLKKIDT